MKDKINEIFNLVKISKFQEALINCENIKDKLDKNIEFLNLYGFILFNLKNFEQAINIWKKVIAINPQFVSAINNIGNAFSQINKLDEAIKYLEMALKINPDFFETHYSLSEIFYKKKIFYYLCLI